MALSAQRHHYNGRSMRESIPSRNDHWLGMCVCRWIWPSKMSPVQLWWNGVNTKPLGARGGRRKSLSRVLISDQLMCLNPALGRSVANMQSWLCHHPKWLYSTLSWIWEEFLKGANLWGEKVLLIFMFLFTLVLLLWEIYGEFVLMVKTDARKRLKTTNVSFAVVPEILCQLYTL